MKQIKLNGKYAIGEHSFALVDDEDFDRLNKHKWHIKKYSRTTILYAARTCYPNGRQNKLVTIKMHRQILNLIDPKILVDHKNHNGLDNQKINLRIATKSQNCANSTPCGKSKYLGVSKNIQNYKIKDGSIRTCIMWRAGISKDNKAHYLGVFKSEEEAAMAYDIRAKELHGEFANLNFK